MYHPDFATLPLLKCESKWIKRPPPTSACCKPPTLTTSLCLLFPADLQKVINWVYIAELGGLAVLQPLAHLSWHFFILSTEPGEDQQGCLTVHNTLCLPLRGCLSKPVPAATLGAGGTGGQGVQPCVLPSHQSWTKWLYFQANCPHHFNLEKGCKQS